MLYVNSAIFVGVMDGIFLRKPFKWISNLSNLVFTTGTNRTAFAIPGGSERVESLASSFKQETPRKGKRSGERNLKNGFELGSDDESVTTSTLDSTEKSG